MPTNSELDYFSRRDTLTQCRLPDWYPKSNALCSLQVFSTTQLNHPDRRLIGQVLLQEIRCSENCKDHADYDTPGGANSAYAGTVRTLLPYVTVIDAARMARFYCRVLQVRLPEYKDSDETDLPYTLTTFQFAAEYLPAEQRWMEVPLPASGREEVAAYRSVWLHDGYLVTPAG